MTQRTDLLEVLSELVDAIEPYAQSHKFDTPCDCCLCTAIANAEVALASHAPSEAVAQRTPIARYCHHCDNWREGTHPHGEIEHNDH